MNICGCGTCQEAWDAALKDNVRSIEAGECLLWRIQIASAATVQCVAIAIEQFENSPEARGTKLDEMQARRLVAEVMIEMGAFVNAKLDEARKPIADAYATRKN